MTDDLVFKASWAKRALGWFVGLGAFAALLALIRATIVHYDTQTSADLLSGVLIGVFLIWLMVAGVAIQYIHWRIDGEVITHHRLFKRRAIPVADLAGFGYLVIVAGVIPLVHVDLYDRDLNLVARLPVGIKDWPRAEDWLAARLRPVVNDGSAALPKRRFADIPKV